MPHYHYILFYVADLDKSVAFYRDKLGFTLTRLHEGGVAELDFGTAKLYLHLDSKPDMPPPDRAHRGKDVLIGFNPDDVDAYCARVKSNGVAIAKELSDEPWGDRDFSIKDPDGYELWFVNQIKK